MIVIFTAILSMESKYIEVPEEVVYGFVCGFFLFISFLKTTQPIGGK